MVEDIEKLVNGEIPDQIVNPEVISKILETFQGKNNR
jgi:hypothetical protein